MTQKLTQKLSKKWHQKLIQKLSKKSVSKSDKNWLKNEVPKSDKNRVWAYALGYKFYVICIGYRVSKSDKNRSLRICLRV